jgi:acyl dehydratase
MTVMALPSNWIELLGWKSEGLSPIGMVHGEQSVTLDRPLPVCGKAHLTTVLRAVYDKGSGALVVKETRVTADTGVLLGSSRSSVFAQGKGGFGGPRGPEVPLLWQRPDRKPDRVVSLSVGLNQSLIYRLSGDRHPHGFDPVRARADGFERPVYYGLGTYGVACRALLKALCDGGVTQFGHMDARFSKPVYPGDRLDTHIWRTDEGAVFQVLANDERVALDRGVFRFATGEKAISDR